MIPRRIQLSRRKGWRMPENTVKVARPGRWGNPWRIGQRLLTLAGPKQGEEFTVTREKAVEMFRNTASTPGAVAIIRRDLRGKNLACWCKLSEMCHADVLLAVANAKEEKGSNS